MECFAKPAITPELLMPCFARRVLQLGDVPDAVREQYRCGVEFICMGNHDCTEFDRQINERSADCILLEIKSDVLIDLDNCINRLLPFLEINGQISILKACYGAAPWSRIQLNTLFSKHNLLICHEGRLFNDNADVNIWALVVVRSTYNPVSHARHVAGLGRPDCAISILNAIPLELIPDNSTLARLAFEKQQFYHQWQKLRNGQDPLFAFFSKARREFAQVTALIPHLHKSYRLHARYWADMGRHDMAARVLRSIQYVSPETETQHLLLEYENQKERSAVKESAALYHDATFKPRILILTHDYSDYGMDTLYHGLCTVLGKENVTEFPWKPTLHGQNVEAAHHYPCVFNYAGAPKSVSDLVQELKRGHFDLIVFGDVVQMAHQNDIRSLIHAAPHLPVILYDTWDDCFTPMRTALKYTGLEQFDLIFKREMLAHMDYGPNVYPLPFSYAQSLLPPDKPATKAKAHAVFWAGKSEYGLRPLYIPSLETHLGHSLRVHYSQKTYQQRLRHSHIGLSFFGCGFDTVRYWELPANQVMLLAERPPIRILNDFVDGESAVFFDDLPDMHAKLDYYLHHPEQVQRIAAAGHTHYLRYHTTTARAQQFLAVVAEVLGLNNSALKGQGSQNVQTTAKQQDVLCGRRPITTDVSQTPLHLGLVRGDNYGWGVCSNNLIAQLSKIRPVHVLNEQDGSATDARLKGKLFQALTSVEFFPIFKKARAQQNYAYTFFENELTANSLENAKHYELVLGGSTWCRKRMLEKGIENCDVLIQGIDPKFFYPIKEERSRDRFVIFSGGKFELRKGQDLVLRAVKTLQDKYSDVWLINCWYNLWSASTHLMTYSQHINFTHQENESWLSTMQRTYQQNGLDPDRIITYELVPHDQQRELFKQSDVGVFPNRCEGGTNLVLMEYMACAKPVIASNTSGHMDIVTQHNALLLNDLNDMNIVDADGKLIGRWQDPSFDELVAQLEYAYSNRDVLRAIGCQAGKDLQHFTWQHSAQHLLNIIL